MFTRKQTFSSRLKFDKKSFGEITRLLNAGGFGNLSVEIPSEYKNFTNKVFSINEFLEANYNFAAVILTATNQEREVKYLFINNAGTQTTFSDKVFPSGHSVSSQLFVKSDNPLEIIGLLDFASVIIEENSLRSKVFASIQNNIGIFSAIYIFLYTLLLYLILLDKPTRIDPLIESVFSNQDLVLVISLIFIFSLSYLFYYFTHPGGLYINKFEHPIFSFVRRGLVGDFKDNLIAYFFFWILKIGFAALISAIFINIADYIIDSVNLFGTD